MSKTTFRDKKFRPSKFRDSTFRDNLRTGRPAIDPTAPAHTPGVREGNKPDNYEKMEGHYPDGTSSARRSTGVDPSSKNAILPEMPNISPP